MAISTVQWIGMILLAEIVGECDESVWVGVYFLGIELMIIWLHNILSTVDLNIL